EVGSTFASPKRLAGSAPEAPALSSANVNENRSAGTQVGSLTAIDVDQVDAQVMQLVSGAGSADNGLFRISGNQLVLNVKPDYELKSQYQIRVRATDSGRNSVEQPLIVTVNDLLEVEQSVTGDGTAQRSMVQQLSVRFDNIVNIDPGALTVTRRDGNGMAGGVVTTAFTTQVVNSRTVATITFSGAMTRDAFGTLVDGYYTLVIDGSKVHRVGLASLLDGNRDGDEGGDYAFGSVATDKFFARFGDLDGDGIVGSNDYSQFTQAYGKSAGQAGYRRELDYKGVGLIRVFDFNEIRRRLNVLLQF
ncbi:MAG: cadherin repeat domain-containing protein, partial [Planctomycetaceae bacterium]|nr:cadherin repeat domain-containing protein [Planctomycetaceae bacterium]